MLCHTWAHFAHPRCLTTAHPEELNVWLLCVCVCVFFCLSQREMGQREVWCYRAEHWGTTHGVQGSALRPDRSPARQTEGHGEGRHSEGTHVNNTFSFLVQWEKKNILNYLYMPPNFTVTQSLVYSLQFKYFVLQYAKQNICLLVHKSTTKSF